jgi:pimeloyl-ACP methyl ester carboxylesterase
MQKDRLVANETKRLRLRDGRWVAYVERGDPLGVPVFLMQGTPSSRLLHHPDESIARSAGARVITIDRPGFGLSDFHRGRRLLDWPLDVAQVADQLGIERFAVVGFSGGGPYAAACAYQLPNRLTRAMAVAGAGPVDAPDSTAGMTPLRRLALAAAIRAPWALRPLMWARWSPRRNPERFFTQFTAHFPPADRAILAQPEIRSVLIANYAEATRQGLRGLAWEIRLFAQPWGFPLADIATEYHVWHGDADSSTPVGMARYVINAIPGCRSRLFPGEGHMLFFSRWRDILEVLVAPA